MSNRHNKLSLNCTCEKCLQRKEKPPDPLAPQPPPLIEAEINPNSKLKRPATNDSSEHHQWKRQKHESSASTIVQPLGLPLTAWPPLETTAVESLPQAPQNSQERDELGDLHPDVQISYQMTVELVEIGKTNRPPIIYTPKRWNNTIGRTDNFDLVANSIYVSRKQHACIVYDPVANKMILSDCDSSNGIYVNNERVATVELHEGDEVGIGCDTTEESINDPDCIVLRFCTNYMQPVDNSNAQDKSSDNETKFPINNDSNIAENREEVTFQKVVARHKPSVKTVVDVENNGWIDDKVICIAMEMLVAQQSNVQFVTPALSMMLKQLDVEAWTLDISSSDLVLFPVSNARNAEDTATHWYLLTYNRQTNHSSLYDSLYNYGEITNDNVMDYCGKINEFMNFQRNHQHQQQHRFTVVPCTQQNNGNDCGVHVILNAEAAIKSFHTNSGFEAVSYEAVTEKRRQMARDLREAITEQSPKDNSNDDKIPERAEHRQTYNAPLHTGVKVKSGRAVRRAKYAKKRQDAQKAINAARFGRPAMKKLKAKRLNLGILTKLYTKPIPATPHGNRMPRSKTNNKLRQKKTVRKVLHRQRSKLEPDEECFTIVRTLNGFLADTPEKHQLRDRFILDSKVISALSIESSYMINWYFVSELQKDPNFALSEKPKFREYFQCLKQSGKGATYKNMHKIMRPYFELRKKYGQTSLYASENRTNSISLAADTYETSFANNVTEHMYKRVQKFFKLTNPEIKSYETLDNLFNSQSENRCDMQLLKTLRQTLGFTGNFHNLNSNWWSFIPFLYRLQQWHVKNGSKSFRVFPILGKRRHYVQYDGQAYHQFLRNWKISSTCYDDFDEDVLWRRYFKIDEVESDGHKFHNHIRTDGVSVSITMKRKKRSVAENAQRMAQANAKLKRNEIKNVRAYDPGHRLIFAGIDRDLETGQETSLKYSSRSYHYTSGRHRFQEKYNRLANPLLRKLQTDRETLPNKASAVLDFKEFINFELKHFCETNEVLMSQAITKLRFQRFVSREKATTELAKALVGSRTVTNTTIVFCGSTEQNPVIKGYVRTPNKKIFAEIQRLAPFTFKIDEFRSTMLCSRCFTPAITSRSPHRWQYCKRCAITWNRDVNAGRNICYLGLNEILGVQCHQGFSRLFKFPGTAKQYQHWSEKAKPHTRRDTINQRCAMRQLIAK